MFAANASAVSSAGGYRYWRIKVTAPASNVSISEWKVVESTGTLTSLVGKTTTALAGGFETPYGLSLVNDGTAETTNGANIANSGTAAFDAYVDLGAAYTVTAYDLAPQGGGSSVHNTPTSFEVYAANTVGTWTLKATFTGISTTYPAWAAGSYRRFSW